MSDDDHAEAGNVDFSEESEEMEMHKDAEKRDQDYGDYEDEHLTVSKGPGPATSSSAKRKTGSVTKSKGKAKGKAKSEPDGIEMAPKGEKHTDTRILIHKERGAAASVGQRSNSKKKKQATGTQPHQLLLPKERISCENKHRFAFNKASHVVRVTSKRLVLKRKGNPCFCCCHSSLGTYEYISILLSDISSVNSRRVRGWSREASNALDMAFMMFNLPLFLVSLVLDVLFKKQLHKLSQQYNVDFTVGACQDPRQVNGARWRTAADDLVKHATEKGLITIAEMSIFFVIQGALILYMLFKRQWGVLFGVGRGAIAQTIDLEMRLNDISDVNLIEETIRKEQAISRGTKKKVAPGVGTKGMPLDLKRIVKSLDPRTRKLIEDLNVYNWTTLAKAITSGCIERVLFDVERLREALENKHTALLETKTEATTQIAAIDAALHHMAPASGPLPTTAKKAKKKKKKSKITIEGYLDKKNHHGRFQKRWFVLQGSQLIYYPDKPEDRVGGVLIQTKKINARATLSLGGCTIEPDPDLTIAITAPQTQMSNFILRASSEEDQLRWVGFMQAAAEMVEDDKSPAAHSGEDSAPKTGAPSAATGSVNWVGSDDEESTPASFSGGGGGSYLLQPRAGPSLTRSNSMEVPLLPVQPTGTAPQRSEGTGGETKLADQTKGAVKWLASTTSKVLELKYETDDDDGPAPAKPVPPVTTARWYALDSSADEASPAESTYESPSPVSSPRGAGKSGKSSDKGSESEAARKKRLKKAKQKKEEARKRNYKSMPHEFLIPGEEKIWKHKFKFGALRLCGCHTQDHTVIVTNKRLIIKKKQPVCWFLCSACCRSAAMYDCVSVDIRTVSLIRAKKWELIPQSIRPHVLAFCYICSTAITILELVGGVLLLPPFYCFFRKSYSFLLPLGWLFLELALLVMLFYTRRWGVQFGLNTRTPLTADQLFVRLLNMSDVSSLEAAIRSQQ